MGESRTIVRNTMLLTVGLMVGRVLAVFVTRMMTGLGTADFGVWGWATDTTTIVLTITNFGLGTLITREVSRAREMTLRIMLSVLGVRWAMAAVCYLGLLAYLHLTAKTDFEQAALLVCALAVFVEATSMACDAVLQAHQKVKYQTVGQVVSAIVYFGAAWWALSHGHGVMGVVWSNLISRLARLVVMVPLMLIHAGPWRLSGTVAERSLSFRWLLKMGWPLFLSTTMAVIYNKVDVVMLKEMQGSAETGIYVLGHRVYDILVMLPNLFATALFPTMAAYGTRDAGDVTRLGERSLRLLLGAMLPLTLLVVLAAPLIIGWFDRAGIFAASIPVQQLIVLALPMQAAMCIFNRLLITAGREKAFVSIASVTMVINVGLNLLLIPRYSYTGAAIATLVSVLVSCVMHFGWVLRTPYGFSPARMVGAAVASLAVAWLGAVALLGLIVPAWDCRWSALPIEAGFGPVVVVCLVTGVLYVAAALVFGVVRRDELRFLSRG